jgi:outer membrane murein-binding lipoprotein Lpp
MLGGTTVMEDGLNSVSARPGRNLIAVAVAATALLLPFASVGATDAAAAKKLHACVTKRGPDKGAMRFSRTGKCHKGEKRLSWGKKGKPGKTGPAGPAGQPGPQGPSGITDELLATIATQQTEIDQLTTQLTTVTSQLDALTSQLNGLAPTINALCAQMDAVTAQSDALRTVISGLDVTLGVLTIPALPAALGSFSCP